MRHEDAGMRVWMKARGGSGILWGKGQQGTQRWLFFFLDLFVERALWKGERFAGCGPRACVMLLVKSMPSRARIRADWASRWHWFDNTTSNYIEYQVCMWRVEWCGTYFTVFTRDKA